jgi:hypothetical protein
MSFCVVPVRAPRSAPCSSATATYSANSHTAVALMVIEVFMSWTGRPSNTVRMSPRWQIGTPTRPTSPRASSWSESYPVCVGRSKATERPVWPLARFLRYRSLVTRGFP